MLASDMRTRAQRPARTAPEAGASRLSGRLGLSVPREWWPSAPLLKSYEAAGFEWVQLHSPPASVLRDPRLLRRHAAAASAALETTALAAVIHGPSAVQAGTPEGDRALEGLLSYAAEAGAAQVVHHALAYPDGPATEDALLFETRSLAGLATVAERLEVTIAIENLCPLYPEPETRSANPMSLRSVVQRIGSDRVAICLDLGHAHVIADLKHTGVERLVEPVLDLVSMFHVHDNLGARRHGRPERERGIDPLRLDLHLPPGRGTVPWERIAPPIATHPAPLLLEVHPPYRPRSAQLAATAVRSLAPDPPASPSAG